MNRAERIFKLDALLQDKRPVSMQRFRETLDVSRATIVRDLEYMRDFMGAPIVYDRSANGYHYALHGPTFELPGLWFNASELCALLASEQILENVQPGLLNSYLEPLRVRIRDLLSKTGHQAETINARIRLQSVGMRWLDGTRFGTVAQAVLEGRVLNMEYHGRERDRISARRVFPRQLWHYRGNWYLVAWCTLAQDLRTFSLDRIQTVRIDEETAPPADEDALQNYLSASFGIFTGPPAAWAVLRFSPRMARWVADEHWHPQQIGQWNGDRYELRIPYSDPRELLMDILKYGPEVEVLEPAALREMVVERLEAAWRQYQR